MPGCGFSPIYKLEPGTVVGELSEALEQCVVVIPPTLGSHGDLRIKEAVDAFAADLILADEALPSRPRLVIVRQPVDCGLGALGLLNDLEQVLSEAAASSLPSSSVR